MAWTAESYESHLCSPSPSATENRCYRMWITDTDHQSIEASAKRATASLQSDEQSYRMLISLLTRIPRWLL